MYNPALVLENDTLKLLWDFDIQMYARQTISLSVLARNPNKGLELEISYKTGIGRGEGGPREEKSVDKGTQREQSITERRRD